MHHFDDSGQVAPVPVDKVSQVESEPGFFALSDNRIEDCERYVLLRRWALHAAHCQARGYLPSDRLVQLFQGICDFSGCVDYFDQGEVSDSVDDVIVDFPLPVGDLVLRNFRVICRSIEVWWSSRHVVSPEIWEKWVFMALSGPGRNHQRRSSTADESGLPDRQCKLDGLGHGR